MSVRIRLLANENTRRQPILRQRQRTRRELVERARRIVGLVEIENRRPVRTEVRVEEPGRVVRLLAAGPVAEDEEETVRPGRHRPEAQLRAVQRELDDALG